MKRKLVFGDITETVADALIYSTNVQLMLSGGVGASLLRRYGVAIQDELYRCIDSTGRKLADVGEVFTTSPKCCPWKIIFHAVAADPNYHTDPSIVQTILMTCFDRCVRGVNIQSIVLSPLGTGYGDLPLETFLDLVSTVSSDPTYERISEVIVCCDHVPFFDALASHAPRTGLEWIIQGERGYWRGPLFIPGNTLIAGNSKGDPNCEIERACESISVRSTSWCLSRGSIR